MAVTSVTDEDVVREVDAEHAERRRDRRADRHGLVRPHIEPEGRRVAGIRQLERALPPGRNRQREGEQNTTGDATW